MSPELQEGSLDTAQQIVSGAEALVTGEDSNKWVLTPNETNELSKIIGWAEVDPHAERVVITSQTTNFTDRGSNNSGVIDTFEVVEQHGGGDKIGPVSTLRLKLIEGKSDSYIQLDIKYNKDDMSVIETAIRSELGRIGAFYWGYGESRGYTEITEDNLLTAIDTILKVEADYREHKKTS